LAARALVEAGVSVDPGRGAVSLLGMMAVRHASTERPIGRATGLPRRLVAALTSYEALLERFGLIESAEAARVLSLGVAPADAVGVIGFSGLIPAQEALLCGWAATGADVLVEIPWSDGTAGTKPSEPLIRRLAAAGARVVDLGGPADDRPAELRRIATQLFSGPAPQAGEGRVRLGIARGDEGEARLIATYLSDLLVAGAQADTVAVAFADPGCHSGWLRTALTDAGVSADWDVMRPVAETPFGRALLRLWAFCRRGMDREDLGAFLRSPFSGAGMDRVDAADIAWRHAGLLSGPGLLPRAGEARYCIDQCRVLASQRIGPESGKNWKSLADRLLSNAYPGTAPVISKDGVLDAAVHRSFCGSVEAAVALGERVLDADELMSAFADCSVTEGGARSVGSILVTSVDRLYRETLDHVIIGGLTSAEFPRRGAEDRMEGDAVRTALSALGIMVDADERTGAERLAFYLAVSSPRRSLALVRRESDDEGRALSESVFWDEFLDLYRAPGGRLADASGLPVDVPSSAGADRREGRCRERGIVADERVLAELADIRAVSPGAVESYNACPYRWFVERGLRPSTPDRALDRMAAGRTAHEALADFYRRRMGTGARVTPSNVSEALVQARECLDRAIAEAPRPSGLEEQRLLSDVASAVERLVARDVSFLPDFVPAYVEWAFGLQEGDEPVDLGGVLVKGRADRIDIGPEGLVVIDYKRSRVSSLADIARDGLVQLQLYAAAASRRLGLPVAGGLYRSLGTGDDRGFVLSGVSGTFKARDVLDREGVGAVIEQAVGAAREAVEGMRAGRIAPSPAKERCAYCVAAPFCPEAVRS
jgi:RecB family exonuclease